MKGIPIKEIPKEEDAHLEMIEFEEEHAKLAPEHQLHMLKAALYFRDQTFELRERLNAARDVASRLEFPDTTGR